MRRLNKWVSIMLGLSMVFSGTVRLGNETTFAQGVFDRASDGRPIFTGNPDDLDAFVDLILDDMTLEEKAIYAVHRYSEGGLTLERGYTLPSGKGEVDAVQGVYTDFPTMQALGQSWDTELIKEVGTAIGNERRGEVANYDGMTMMYSAEADIRVNPLAGRFEEGFSEDPGMVGDMVSAMGDGITGNGASGNEDGFWLKVGLGTKHYANYAAEFYRNYGSSYNSIRGLREFALPGFLTAAENGSITGVMTSYGRLNGIPAAASGEIELINDAAPYSLWNVSDFIGDYSLYGSCGNGFDATYSPDRAHAAALLLLSGSTENCIGGTAANGGTADDISESSWGTPDTYITPSAIVEAVEKGIWGVTEDDLDNCIRGLLELFVRTGCFNADEDGDGKPDGYVFADLAQGESTSGSYTDVALESAEASLVLLKNQNLLPLDADSFDEDNPLVLSGAFADARFKTVYSTATPNVENAGQTPLTAIQEYLGEENVCFENGNKIVAIQTNDGKYIAVDADGSLSVKSEMDDSCKFELYSWGQDAYSFKSVSNGKWLNRKSEQQWQIWQYVTVYTDELECTGEERLDVGGEWNADGTAITSTMPERFRIEDLDDEISIVAGTYEETFSGGYETAYYDDGMRFSYSDSSVSASASTLNSITDAEKFQLVVCENAGDSVSTDGEYAVVVVGIPSQHSMGEGADRSSLAMGSEQYELVEAVGEQYPGKTIVVVKSNASVLMEEIENNDNIGAIIYAPYGGQYDGYALARVIFGDAAPTGHLTCTWYDSDEVLPEISEYSLPEAGMTETYLPAVSLDQVDPRITVDYTNNDPIDTELTYMYTDDDHVTYPFGHGLTYADVDLSLLYADGQMKKNQNYTVKALAVNNSDVPATQVVQVYATPQNSAYGDAAFDKKLIGYKKVQLNPYQAKEVRITCDIDCLKVFDVNRQTNVLESGYYNISVGLSSRDLNGNQRIRAIGDTIGSLDTSEAINLYEHTFASENITYREASKANTALYEGAYYALMSKEAGAYAAICKVDMTGITGISAEVASCKDDVSIEVRVGSETGTVIATISADDTGSITIPVTYTGDYEQDDVKNVTEMQYEDVTASVTSTRGTKDLYFVFSDKDVRIKSVQFTR
ncbi:MAG: carbohydrate-binding protein [Lachnospiraceae bacterium]|nr:carbohydrate-binding protein [Lachnospiraceae bacterium]